MCVYAAAVTELQGSANQLTLNVINENMTSYSADNSTLILTMSADVSQVLVSDLEPDTVYSSVLTVTVHGGSNITSDPDVTRTTSGG